MLIRELNQIQCKTYLVACAETRRALLIDPERGHVDRYLGVLAYEGLRLDAVIDTHTHADHLSGAALMKELTGVRLIMHKRAPTPQVDAYVDDGETIDVGRLSARVLHTPGHTPDSLSLLIGDHVFTGDVLLIGGTGRTDFAGGDSGEQYDSITEKLFTLPDATVVHPAHDYRGNTVSSIGHERTHNPRLKDRGRQEYIDLMASIAFPLPSKIQEVLQPNQTAIDDDKIHFPDLSQLNEVRQLAPHAVRTAIAENHPPLLLDVREQSEFQGELGHIRGSILIPLKQLPERADELSDHQASPIVVVCRSGVRSTTAAAILTGLGFTDVSNLRGGMVDWNELGLPVERQ